MDLQLVRTDFTPLSTIGTVFRNGIHQCFILEDTCREAEPGLWTPELKVAGKTAIPYGRYEIAISYSERFKKLLPLLMRVPNYEGVRIHPGNDADDTEGCLLPGTNKEVDRVTLSVAAFNELFRRIQEALQREKVWIDIVKAGR